MPWLLPELLQGPDLPLEQQPSYVRNPPGPEEGQGQADAARQEFEWRDRRLGDIPITRFAGGGGRDSEASAGFRDAEGTMALPTAMIPPHLHDADPGVTAVSETAGKAVLTATSPRAADRKVQIAEGWEMVEEPRRSHQHD
jgi:hypothetical protein